MFHSKKSILLILFIYGLPLLAISQINNFNDFYKQSDRFFSENVKNGLVKYKEIKEAPEQLKKLVSFIKETQWRKTKDKTQKAYLINAYNLLVINRVIKNYPIGSPTDIPGFFDQKKHQLGSEKYTLDEIENKLLRKKFPDARLHFALVCAAKGCPLITSYAYKPDKLNEQLKEKTRKYINNPENVRVQENNKKVKLSELFRWYKKDFTKDHPDIISFINEYRNKPIPEDYKIDYYFYDWELNDIKNADSKASDKQKLKQPITSGSSLQNYTPSILLNRGQFEFKHFNNLYTQTANFNSDWLRKQSDGRGSWFTSINQFLYGLTPHINIGGDLWMKSVRIEDKQGVSPLNTLRFQDISNARTAISGLGPKIKIAPFKNIKRLSIQSTFLFPVAEDLDGSESKKPFLSNEAYLWLTEFFYDYQINNNYQLFFRLSSWGYIGRDFTEKNSSFSTPASVFFSAFPTQRLTIYYMTELWPTYGTDPFFDSFFMQNGPGIKYQIVNGFLELEASYTNFSLGKNSGAGQTFNLGIRIIN